MPKLQGRNFKISFLLILLHCFVLYPCYTCAESDARRYLREENYSTAIKVCNDLIRINPNNYEPYYDLGAIYNALGKYDHALEYYKKALKLNPSKSLIYSDIGNTYGDKGQYRESIKWYEKAIEVDPGVCDYYTYLGEVYENFGEYRDALRWYHKAIEVDDKDSDSYYDIGRIYKDMGNYDEAVKWHKKAISIDAKNTKAYYGLGMVYEEMGRYDEAEKFYKEAVKIDPEEFRAYFGLGNISSSRYRFDEAKMWYNKSISKSPPQRFILCPYEGLGLVYLKLGQPQEAEEVFSDMVKIRPYDPLGYYNLARYLFQVGKYELAGKNINKALLLVHSPIGRRQYLELKGFILIMQEDYSQAELLFNRLLKEYGTDCATLAGLGHIANARKDYKTARNYFEQAISSGADIRPEDRTIALLGLGWINANEHKHREAIAFYQKVLKEEPLQIVAMIGMGKAYQQLRDFDKSEAYFKRVSIVNPDFLKRLDRQTSLVGSK
jgi:tetratricopeptide (TPR) repeat protein